MGGQGSGDPNWRKGLTHCPQGHEFSTVNTYVNPRTSRRTCRTCKRGRANAFYSTEIGKQVRRRNRIKTDYGLTKEQTDQQLLKQNNCCLLCNRTFVRRIWGAVGNGTGWVVDHDHGTGKFRGLIHQNCNLALGYMEDDPELCRLAALYLEKFNAVDG